MPLRESRARAENVFIRRAIDGWPWSKIRDEYGFGSVGAAQMAYRRFKARNPVPDGETALAEIVARRREAQGAAFAALRRAEAAGDNQMVAALVNVITRSDSDLAKLYGLGSQNVTVAVDAAPVLAAADVWLRQVREASAAAVSGGQPAALESAAEVIDAEVIDR